MRLDPDTLDKLKRISHAKEALSAGRLRAVPIDHVRSVVGEQWEAKKARFGALIESTMRRRLGPADVLIDLGDQGFLVVYAELVGEEANLKTAAIAEEAFRIIIGEDAANEAIVELREETVELSREDVAHMEALAGAGEGASEAEACAAARGGGAPDRDAVRPPAGPAGRPAAADATTEILDFQPVWWVSRRVIFNYRLRFFPDAARIVDLLTGGGGSDPAASRLERDLHGARMLIARAESQRRQARCTFLTLPVGRSSLSLPAFRTRLLGELTRAPQDDRRRIILEIEADDAQLSEHLWDEMARSVRTAGLRVRARVSEYERDLARFRDMGYGGLGLDLGRGGDNAARQVRRLEFFARQVAEAKIPAFLLGVDSLPLMTHAVCAGYDELAGRIVEREGAAEALPLRYFERDAVGRMIA